MKYNKKFYIPIIFIIAVFSCILIYSNMTNSKIQKVYTSGDYPHYSEMNSLVDKSDVIIEGDVIKVHSPKKLKYGEATSRIDGSKKELYNVYTISDVKVSKVIKGNVKIGDVIQIKQQGGLFEDKLYISEDVQMLNKDEAHLLFLASFKDSPYSTLNPTQGDSIVTNGKIKPHEKNDIIPKKISEEELVKDIKKVIEQK